jgi:hypothetical protein
LIESLRQDWVRTDGDFVVKKKRFTEEQIIGFLREAERGVAIGECPTEEAACRVDAGERGKP